MRHLILALALAFATPAAPQTADFTYPALGADGATVRRDMNAELGNIQTLLGGKLPAASVSAFGFTLIDDASAAVARATLGIGSAALSSAGDFAAYVHGHVAADISDATSFGRGLLTAASVAAQRTALGLGTAALSATGDFAAAVHGHTAAQISDATVAGRALLTAADAAAQRVALALVPGTDVQAYDQWLADLSALTPTANRYAYYNNSTVATLGTITAFGRSLIDDADATAAGVTLGLGTLATQSGTFSGTSSGTNTGDQTIALTGDVGGTGTGSFAATVQPNAVALTSDTTGNYVAGLTASTGLAVTGTAGEGWSPVVAPANDLAALEGLTGTGIIPWRSAADTWGSITIGSGLSFTAGTLSATGGGGGLAGTDIDTSAELRAIITDEVGTGSLAFGLAPALADDLGCTGSQVVRRNSGDTAFECATAVGVPSAQIDEYSTAGGFTWTKPAGARFVEVVLIGAGGGSGGGRLRADSTTAAFSGGSGGGGGRTEIMIPAASLGATVSVTVGTGGTAGAGRNTTAADGGAGGSGGDTNFGSFRARGGLGGAGGTVSAGAGGASGGAVGEFSASATAYSAAGVSGVGNSNGNLGNAGGLRAGGGGTGGGHSASTIIGRAGGAGGLGAALFSASTATTGGGGAGANTGISGTAGAASVDPAFGGSGGGGGGNGNGGNAGDGGAGGYPGGGAGSGGAGTLPFTSGAGAIGAAGFVRVITTF